MAAADIEAFEDAWRIVRDDFYDRNHRGVDWEGARRRYLPRAKAARTRRELHEVVLAMLGELKSSHTALAEPDVYRDLIDGECKGSLTPTFGVELARTGEGYFVSETPGGSPAAEAGILRGDRLLRVDDFSPDEVVRPCPWDVGLGGRRSYFVSAASGKSVVLAFQRKRTCSRPGWDSYSVTLSPRPWNLVLAMRASACSKEVAPGMELGYVRLHHVLTDDVPLVLQEILASPPISEASGVVLDIRGHGGLPSAIDGVLELFDRNARGGALWGRPAALVVDSETRSAKEILAWRWRNERRGPIVGTRTRGAVLGSRYVPLHDGSFMQLAWLDVRVLSGGARLEGKGVVPDFVVPDDLPYAEGQDPLIEKANAVLLEKVLEERRRGRTHGWY
ncbi:hypothetical protein HY251_03715 [bacterium]|nr:hypothetical protein [bacterium]